MDSKPSDIGETCHIYETFGKCAYGLSCRFAKAHTTPDFKSMEKADLVKVYEGRTMVKNNMSKELQGRLRKRSVSFEKSEKYLKTLSDNKDKGAQQGDGKTSEMLPSQILLMLFRKKQILSMSLKPLFH